MGHVSYLVVHLTFPIQSREALHKLKNKIQEKEEHSQTDRQIETGRDIDREKDSQTVNYFTKFKQLLHLRCFHIYVFYFKQQQAVRPPWYMNLVHESGT